MNISGSTNNHSKWMFAIEIKMNFRISKDPSFRKGEFRRQSIYSHLIKIGLLIWFSWNSEADTSEFLENVDEMSPRYYIDSDVSNRFKSSTTHMYVTRADEDYNSPVRLYRFYMITFLNNSIKNSKEFPHSMPNTLLMTAPWTFAYEIDSESQERR